MKLSWRKYQSGASLDLMRDLPKGSCASIRFHWTIINIGINIEVSRQMPGMAINLGIVSFMVWF